MNNLTKPSRRQFLLSALLLPFSSLARAGQPTPVYGEGPFYPTPKMRYPDTDSDLVKISGAVRAAGGEIVIVSGRVLDRSLRPLKNARVEIWQCDVNGRYIHDGEPYWQTRDQGFQGFGHAITDAEGRYQFRTIKPVPYPGRCPHIHAKVWYQGKDRLTTQLFLPNHPLNERDGLYRHIPKSERERVHLNFDSADEPMATIDLII